MLSACLCALISSGSFAAQNNIPDDQPNCAIARPPYNAGEDNVHGMLMRIYPRRSEMSKTYTGCQTTWLAEDGTYQRFMITFFSGGDLRIIKGLAPGAADDFFICAYQDNKPVPDDGICPDLAASIRRGLGPPRASMPAGCFKKVSAAAAASSPAPAECKYD